MVHRDSKETLDSVLSIQPFEVVVAFLAPLCMPRVITRDLRQAIEIRFRAAQTLDFDDRFRYRLLAAAIAIHLRDDDGRDALGFATDESVAPVLEAEIDREMSVIASRPC